MTELRECPFCGGTAIDVGLEAYRPVGGTPDDRWRVRCKSCWSPGAWGDSSDEAITHWNTRAPDPLVDAVVQAASPILAEVTVTDCDCVECRLMRALLDLREAQG